MKKTALAAMAVITGLAGQASADMKEYIGASCKPASGSYTNYDYSWHAIRNLSSNTNMLVVCPIVRDKVNDDLEYVRMEGYNSGQSTSYLIVSQAGSGSTYSIAATGTISGTTIRTWGAGSTNIAVPDKAAISLQATLPVNGGSVLQYRVDED